MKKYVIDELIEIFQKHALERDEFLRENKEKYTDFNISSALFCMCKEIEELQDKVGSLEAKID